MIMGLGMVVVGAIAYLCPRFGRIGAATVGLACGLFPSAFILALPLVVSRHNMFEMAGAFAIAVIVAVPSGAAGALAGIICSGQQKKTLVVS